MSCKPSSQFLGTILETNRDDLWNKVGLTLESKGMLLNSTTLELITIHYLISNQIEFKVQNKFAMCKNLKWNSHPNFFFDNIIVRYLWSTKLKKIFHLDEFSLFYGSSKLQKLAQDIINLSHDRGIGGLRRVGRCDVRR